VVISGSSPFCSSGVDPIRPRRAGGLSAARLYWSTYQVSLAPTNATLYLESTNSRIAGFRLRIIDSLYALMM